MAAKKVLVLYNGQVCEMTVTDVIDDANLPDFVVTGNFKGVGTSASNFDLADQLTTIGITLTGLTASQSVQTDANKKLVSLANTGTGNNALADGPSLSKVILGAGVAAAGGAPLKFTSGTNTTTAVAGQLEYNGTILTFTPTGTTRQTFAYLGLTQTWTAQQSGTTPTAKDNTTKFATTAYVGKQFRAQASGNGSSTSIVIAHGVASITSASSVIATAHNSASAGWSYITIDATNITIVYTTAPVTGTNNLDYSFSIK